MELYQLDSFLAVAHSGSLSKAAVIRNISLPGISKHIKMLEEHFGQALFTRTPKGMILTEKGEQVRKYAERIQKDIDSLNGLARQKPPLRLGLNIAPDFLQLFQLKNMLEQYHPNREIVLINHNSGHLLDLLYKKELDLCLAFGSIPEHLQKILIRKVQLPLMLPQNLPDDLPDLNELCWIINTQGCPFADPLKAFWRAHTIRPQSTILAQDLSRKELVAQGLGIGFLEPQDALALSRNSQGKRYGEYCLTIPLWVVFQDEIFRDVAEHLQHHVQARYDTLPPCPNGYPQMDMVARRKTPAHLL
ncbi:LysR family transcriptional regulator [Desulfopila aestuarii]|uniref:DNA-binding transcriptional regulator, LysR family n=1 Tax=Desulfopila aestuarii DSM 18488 TaxID=1121416 RepID=A0A1M7YH06_9BACT|nr:LysR family transcriptional regulator [Desulfopila aestuarii]SHO51883.1 DNA-binding transcriptional regulator, LysR family [Desulfopila aestuarii DSM 18488]